MSAALRRRLISEEEVVRAVLAAHPYPAVEKFIAEVFWRTYWKGWLEQRCELWPRFRQEITAEKTQLEAVPVRSAAYQAAMAGQTGIEAFDHWAAELARTGYLHNWARMQVASIWTFTLRLPWQMGADWMFSHLLDADPASNTLSWRWVAGLHTAGKAYLADEQRIISLTGGALTAKGLAEIATIPPAAPPPCANELRCPCPPDPKVPSLLLLTSEDLSLETELKLDDLRGIVISADLIHSKADRIAMTDARERAARHWAAPSFAVTRLEDLAAIASNNGCTQIVTGFAPVGPIADALEPLRPLLADRGIAFTEHQRRWDWLAWPFCGKGFFQLKSRIPSLLRDQGISDCT